MPRDARTSGALTDRRRADMTTLTCSIEECAKPTGAKGTARGFCSMHYNRWRRNGDPLIRTQRTVIAECTVEGCQKPHDAKGLCTSHVTKLRRYGTPIYRKPGSVVDGKKICAECLAELPVANFYPVGKSLNARCIPCYGAKIKAYRETRIEIVRAQGRASAALRAPERRDASRKRRALVREATVEDVSSIDVYDRDNWTCGICDAGIPRVTIWPHPLSPSLDHIQAISTGGAHSYANTQASHLACNMSKGARAA